VHPIELLITRLVQEAPVLDDEVVLDLVTALRRDGRPPARSIAMRPLDLIRDAAA